MTESTIAEEIETMRGARDIFRKYWPVEKCSDASRTDVIFTEIIEELEFQQEDEQHGQG